jgi:uncharacterized OsmC-like protein
MKKTSEIKRAFDRNACAMKLRPKLAQATGVTSVRIRNGLTCEIEDGDWKFVADMPESCAGANAGPDPGPLGRGALGACLAMGYTMWAAQLDIPLDEVEVEIAADYDVRGFYGVADVPCGYLELRYTVRIQSEAPENDILRLLDKADNHSPWHEIFRTAQKLKRDVVITRSNAASSTPNVSAL